MVRIDMENKSGWDSDRSKPGGGFKTPTSGIIIEPGKQTEADYVSFVVHIWSVLPLSQGRVHVLVIFVSPVPRIGPGTIYK